MSKRTSVWTLRVDGTQPFTGVLHATAGCTPKWFRGRRPATPTERRTGRPCLRCQQAMQ
jgi:hypothetical protein